MKIFLTLAGLLFEVISAFLCKCIEIAPNGGKILFAHAQEIDALAAGDLDRG